MKIKTGNMWDCFNETDHFLITTNATIKHNGALVMGAGIAKQCRDRFPGIDKVIGKAVLKSKKPYGLIIGNRIGLFQVKNHYSDLACIELITKSTNMLDLFARQYPNRTFALNFPEIRCGKLKYNRVLEVLVELPDNVTLWKYK